MRKIFPHVYLFITVFFMSISIQGAQAAEPSGAKAIFDSGEGPSIAMQVEKNRTVPTVPKEVPVVTEKYMGISYKLVLLSDDGQFKIVPKTRVFKSGERLKLLVRTNRPGYMTIYNIGPSGNTHLLFNEYIEAFTFQEIPKSGNFKFIGEPGTEKMLIMLSGEPHPVFNQPTVTTAQPETLPAPDTYSEPPMDTSYTDYAGETTSSDFSDLPPTQLAQTMDSIDNAKSISGGKDIVIEDSMDTSYTVIAPKHNYKPVKGGMKDVVLESSGGTNYGVIPVSSLSDGGILTLEIKLKHR